MSRKIPSPEDFLILEFDKHERIKGLALIAHHFDQKAYWRTLGEIWTHNESLFQDIDLLEHLLWSGCGIHPAHERSEAMNPEERETLLSLPEEVTLWRGCYAGNASGWCWTLDPDEALFFAGRYAPDGKPLLVKATARKPDILAYFGRHNEREIAIDPKNLSDVVVRKLRPRTFSELTSHYFLSHSGRLPLPGITRAKAMLHALNGISWSAIDRHYLERLAALDHYGLSERATQVRAERAESLDAYQEGIKAR